jgi:hypothetical protein
MARKFYCFEKAIMKKVKSSIILVWGILINLAACNYHGGKTDSSGSPNKTSSEAVSPGTPSSAGATSGSNSTTTINPSLTDTLFRSDSTNSDTLR